jgi:O-antigen/teichoic acid export membrane protein
MKAASRVIQNSLWMSIQPLILNVVSLFATAYIVRGLTQEHYGHFIMAFSLVQLLTPLCALGLRPVMVREVASDLDKAPVVIGNVLTLRLLLAIATYVVAAIVVNVLDYPTFVKFIVYIACSTLIFNTISNNLIDVFQGYERMKYIAYGNFTAGSVLTLFSVLAIRFGFGVVGLTIAYVIGPMLLATMLFTMHRRLLPHFRLRIDTVRWRDLLKKAMPFFWVNMLWMFVFRIGILMLSKMKGDEAVALFGAASGLVDRLAIIPDSIGTALFPTIAAMFARNAKQEISKTVGKAFEFMIIFGLGIAVGMSLLSEQVMSLVYGSNYATGGVVLRVISWYVPFWFLMLVLTACLGAARQQSKVVISVATASVVGLLGNVLLIPRFGAIGLAVADLIFYVVFMVLGYEMVRRHIGFTANLWVVLRILLANAIMGAAVYYLRGINLAVAIIVPAGLYFVTLVGLRVLTKNDLQRIFKAVFRRGQTEDVDGEEA